MAQPVWVLSVDLQTKTATFVSGMGDAAKSARGAFTDIKSGASEMGGHVSTNMFASRHAVMALSEAFGDTMPRAITALLVHIGPLGAALEAAFPFAAIALGAVLLLGHLEKLKAAGVELTEDQINFGTAAQNAFNALDQKMLQAQIRSDELHNNHLAALHHELQLINAQSMDELVHSFGELAKSADVVFAKLKTSWYQFGEGSAGAKNALDEFQTKYASFLAKGDSKGASDLLAGTLDSAKKILALQKEAAATPKSGAAQGGDGFDVMVKKEMAISDLRRMNKDYDEKALGAQQQLVDILNDQAGVEQRVANIRKQDGANASDTTAKAGAGRAAEAAREAAQHTQKVGELTLSMERESAAASATLKAASIADRLASDIRLADEETAIQMRGNQQLIDALNRGADDYNNQLQSLQDKAAEITLQHTVTVAGLTARASEAQYRQDLQDLVAGEHEKIEATEQGSAARLAAINAAIKEEQAKNLENTEAYRELLKQRVQAEREAAAESAKLAAEAGKQQAEGDEKTALTALESQRSFAQLVSSLGRSSAQQQLQQDLAFAQEEFSIKQEAAQQELDALDKTDKDYLNKKRELANKLREMSQQNNDSQAQIAAKSAAQQQAAQNAALAQMENSFAQSFLRVLEGHESFAKMMNQASQQLVGNLVQAGIAMAAHADDAKLSEAKDAARQGFVWGTKYGGPAAPVLAPAMAATFFAGVMAFQEGTDSVPGIGRGDKVPAMLEPGEGVVPGGVMDNLRKMASAGDMGGGRHYHLHASFAPKIQAIDATGVEHMLDKHGDKFQQHVERTLRKMNR